MMCDMVASVVPIAVLALNKNANGADHAPEPIYGGYANARGQICLFSENLVYRVNLKYNTVQQRPPLNSGAQARYDAAEAGEEFEYCRVIFRRLSNVEIMDICSSGSFRVKLGST